MALSLTYYSLGRINEDAAAVMKSEAADAIAGQTWASCEPPLLQFEQGHLYGAIKPNITPDRNDLVAADSEDSPDGTLNDVLDILCQLSWKFGIDWAISHDYSEGPIGFIRNGICDPDVVAQCKAIADLANDLGEEGLDT